ncbi:hypothetical protein BCR32DRAFT_270918 [Anaeromyces robustus]|uniref:Uncharacterized protein n=1 Tax=Anaeromyces robustus TaxID=1754192 RepID=A0A1Y1WU81_9FUNG|nr:hypothetical protein BCR32DRAFT_270918 [Anaeromyces robustus]|eukprot:ORX77002.1 hypothetical protein BCR32DRAFT_270918 [Anaeromyces robustus]
MGKNAKLYKRISRKEKEKLKIAKNSMGSDNSALELKMKKLEESRKKKQERMNKKNNNKKSTIENENQENNDDIMNDGPVSSFRQMQKQRKMTSVEKHEQKYPGLQGRVDYVDLMYKKKTYKPAPGIIN